MPRLLIFFLLIASCVFSQTKRDAPNANGDSVTEPVIVSKPRPPYTPEARKARIEGVLVLQVVIRKNGTVDSFKVIKSLGYGLDESAIKTISKKWKFKPGKFHGVPVDVQANIEVTFRLGNVPDE